jgi:hypothetical protein
VGQGQGKTAQLQSCSVVIIIFVQHVVTSVPTMDLQSRVQLVPTSVLNALDAVLRDFQEDGKRIENSA